MVRRSVVSQLQTVGEDALEKLAQNPAARTAIQGAMQVKERGERLLHALDAIEERLEAIEARLDAIEGTRPAVATAAPGRTAPDRDAERFVEPGEEPIDFGDSADELGEDF